jgi:hypothetical protein
MALSSKVGGLGHWMVFGSDGSVNTASRRVIQAFGMRYVRTYFTAWDDALPRAELGEVEYEMTRAMWEALVAPFEEQMRRHRAGIGYLDPAHKRAGDGNRTRIASLEGWNSAIELHPQLRRR